MFCLKKATQVAKGQCLLLFLFSYLNWFPERHFWCMLKNQLRVFHHIAMNEGCSLKNKE